MSTLAAGALSLFADGADAQSQLSTFNLSATYSGFLQLTTGTPAPVGGRGASLSTQNTGGSASSSPPNIGDIAASIDFGDLSKGDGTPVVGTLGLRIRANTSYRVNAALTSFQANGLRLAGKELNSSNGGSFITITSGTVTATGAAAADPSFSKVNSVLAGGAPLSSLSRGAATPSSTPVISGPIASLGGGNDSQDNAIEVPLLFTVPTGFSLGPSPGHAAGTFNFSVQFGLSSGA